MQTNEQIILCVTHFQILLTVPVFDFVAWHIQTHQYGLEILTLIHYVIFFGKEEKWWMKEDRWRNRSHDVLSWFWTQDPSLVIL